MEKGQGSNIIVEFGNERLVLYVRRRYMKKLDVEYHARCENIAGLSSEGPTLEEAVRLMYGRLLCRIEENANR